MKKFIALAIGLVLFVSAAAADGVGNSIKTEIISEAIDNCVTGNVTIAQVTNSTADLTGCNNAANQYQDLYAIDNDLVDSGTDEGSIFAQIGTQTAIVTSYDKVVNQDILLDAEENCFVNSDLTQAAKQAATSSATQTTDVSANYNEATGSSIMQLSDVASRGTTRVDQNVEYNCLVDSELLQEAEIDTSTKGFGNVFHQTSLQNAECNDLVASALMQCNDIDAINTGNDNTVDQTADANSEDSCLVGAEVLQSIEELAESVGCENDISQDISVNNADNDLVGGSLVQDSTAISSV